MVWVEEVSGIFPTKMWRMISSSLVEMAGALEQGH